MSCFFAPTLPSKSSFPVKTGDRNTFAYLIFSRGDENGKKEKKLLITTFREKEEIIFYLFPRFCHQGGKWLTSRFWNFQEITPLHQFFPLGLKVETFVKTSVTSQSSKSQTIPQSLKFFPNRELLRTFWKFWDILDSLMAMYF